jgi:hypothetical protein
MPAYRNAGARTYQIFPGEQGHATQEPGVSGTVGAWKVSADYFSNPENYGFPEQPSPYSFAEERRATLALYNYRRTDGLETLTPELKSNTNLTYQAPRSWRDAQIFAQFEVPAPPTGALRNLPLLGAGV